MKPQTRLEETIKTIAQTRGQNAKIAVGRELTKVYEETVCADAAGILEYYKNHTLKGEVVVMLYAQEQKQGDDTAILEKIKKLKAANFSNKDIAAIISTLDGVNKNKVYKMTLS